MIMTCQSYQFKSLNKIKDEVWFFIIPNNVNYLLNIKDVLSLEFK